MNTKYRQVEEGSTKVEDLTIAPPVVDVAKLQVDLDNLKQTRKELTDTYNSSLADVSKEINFKQAKLDEILNEVPNMQRLLDNQPAA